MNEVYPFSPFPPEQDGGRLITLERARPNSGFFFNDAAFDWLFPEHLQLISLNHWTPVRVARAAAGYLAAPGARILDIGSGTGKFCLTGAYLYPDCQYYGVEQRGELIYHAERSRDYLGLHNTSFLHANVTQVNFAEFDHFYFYNAFYENIDRENAIDDTIEVSKGLYDYYATFLYHALKHRPAGTRIVTYQCDGDIIPPGYRLAQMSFNTLLRLWIKI